MRGLHAVQHLLRSKLLQLLMLPAAAWRCFCHTDWRCGLSGAAARGRAAWRAGAAGGGSGSARARGRPWQHHAPRHSRGSQQQQDGQVSLHSAAAAACQPAAAEAAVTGQRRCSRACTVAASLDCCAAAVLSARRLSFCTCHAHATQAAQHQHARSIGGVPGSCYKQHGGAAQGSSQHGCHCSFTAWRQQQQHNQQQQQRQLCVPREGAQPARCGGNGGAARGPAAERGYGSAGSQGRGWRRGAAGPRGAAETGAGREQCWCLLGLQGSGNALLLTCCAADACGHVVLTALCVCTQEMGGVAAQLAAADTQLASALAAQPPPPLHTQLSPQAKASASTSALDGCLRSLGTTHAALLALCHAEAAALAAQFLDSSSASTSGVAVGAGVGGAAAGAAGAVDGAACTAATAGAGAAGVATSRVLKLGDCAMKRLRNGDVYKARGRVAACIACRVSAAAHSHGCVLTRMRMHIIMCTCNANAGPLRGAAQARPRHVRVCQRRCV